MKQGNEKMRRNRKMKGTLCALLIMIILYFLLQGVRSVHGFRQAQDKLESYNAETAELSTVR